MKKTSCKILAGVLAAASLASLAACSDSSEGGGSANVETTTTTAKTEWTGDNIEVADAEDSLDTS
ncbi:MAG: hypothetical protein K2J76_00935, partial [Oscillospiraceae bacterium]|nr:hypothetical protein [Oscillospiraceae bacterium]